MRAGPAGFSGRGLQAFSWRPGGRSAGFFLAAGRPICRLSLGGVLCQAEWRWWGETDFPATPGLQAFPAGPAGFFLAAGRPACRLFLGSRAAFLGGRPGGF